MESIRKHELIMSKLIHFGTFFSTFQKGEKKNSRELKLRLDKLEAKIDEFNIIQTCIETKDDFSEQQKKRVKFEIEFLCMQRAAVDELALCGKSSTAHSPLQNDRPDIRVQLKLPRICLPEFAGECHIEQSSYYIFRALKNYKSSSCPKKICLHFDRIGFLL